MRTATSIVEEELADCGAFQYMAILHKEKVTGVRKGRRDYNITTKPPSTIEVV